MAQEVVEGEIVDHGPRTTDSPPVPPGFDTATKVGIGCGYVLVVGLALIFIGLVILVWKAVL